MNRPNSSHCLLCACRIRAGKDCLPRTEDGTSVSWHHLNNMQVLVFDIIYSPVSTFQSYFQRLVKSVRNPGALFNSTPNANPSNALQSFRNVNTAQMVSGAVIVAELLGFFTVGEMIGRMKLVGYRGEHGEHH